jgi:hypothetical protein
MKNLIDRLEVSRNKDSQSYASVVKDSSPGSSTSSASNKRASSTTSTAVASSGSKDVIDFDASIDDNSSDEKDDVPDYSHEQHDDVLLF